MSFIPLLRVVDPLRGREANNCASDIVEFNP